MTGTPSYCPTRPPHDTDVRGVQTEADTTVIAGEPTQKELAPKGRAATVERCSSESALKERGPPFGGYANSACTDPIARRQEAACAIACTLSDGCDTGRSRPTTESVKCLPPSVSLPPRDRTRQYRRGVTLYDCALSFEATQDNSGFLKYSRPGASHDCGASKREKLAEMAALDA